MACSGTRPRAPPLWLHYTAALVVVPLLIAIIASPAGARARAAVGVIVTSGLALLPLMIDQLGRGHEEGVAAQARLNAANLIEVLGAPFYGRTEDATAIVVLGALQCSSLSGRLSSSIEDTGV